MTKTYWAFGLVVNSQRLFSSKKIDLNADINAYWFEIYYNDMYLGSKGKVTCCTQSRFPATSLRFISGLRVKAFHMEPKFDL